MDPPALLADCRRLVRDLVGDLRAHTDGDPEAKAALDAEFRRATGAERTALPRAEWAEGLFAQVAVAWVLGCVFVRFCEDNALVDEPMLGGPGRRRALAIDRRRAYVQAHPADDDRHWLREIFRHYADLPGTGEVFGPHNPVWLRVSPSADGAGALVQAFQAIDPESGTIRHDFTDARWDTRFLGDLYQDLSEQAKKFYALLQTPVFVEEFILDRALDPALDTFGLAATTLIDPACGSGHFLLGAFARLFGHWCEEEPGTNAKELARRALEAIGGVDLNPFAASIARFRLLLAALGAGGDTRLADAPTYPIHVAVGDSLLHGDPPGRLAGIIADDEAAALKHGYATDDVEEARALLSRSWHVVVGNPPYVTPKDPALNAWYRRRFTTCHRQYSLGVPFTELFFQLARAPEGDRERAGYVGMITANSFMKREFGKKLVEVWVPSHDLTHVIDTSGAYIPGHGTPTVILFGRNRWPVASTVRAVMGIRGEPTTPADPEKGLVWSSIVELVDRPGSQSDFVSVADLDRKRLAKHPWSIGGGGAAELKELLDRRGTRCLTSMIEEIGFAAVTREDDAFRIGEGPARRARVSPKHRRPLVAGEEVRDWKIVSPVEAIWPYSPETLKAEEDVHLERFLWPWRAQLSQRVAYGMTQIERGLAWWEYSMFFQKRFRTPLSIAFAFVATHNHFVLDRGGKVFNRSAPVIKLPAGASEERHLELLGVLNSSTACFWMQQVFHNKGGPGGASSKDEKWHDFYEHDGTKLQTLPLPRRLDATIATLLDRMATELASVTPSAVAEGGVPTAERLGEAHRRYDALRAQMIAAQERLDWETYRQYGLVDEELTTGAQPEPPLELGQRAFEIVLARRVVRGESDTKWFSKLGIRPELELPRHWSDTYRAAVERRIKALETDSNIGLIERQECKRRWESDPWDEQQHEALRSWLLDRLESPAYWPQPPQLTTCARLAARAQEDADFLAVARLYAGRDDLDLGRLVADLVTAEAVPYLSSLRYTEAGLRKHAEWESTWALQRREDAGEDVGPIPVPPRYVPKDFQAGVWQHRGKLDVPKERFISYPGAERENDPSLVAGWAGWDHLQRARAVAAWYVQAKRDGRPTDRLAPLLQGLIEISPWLLQWYNEANPDPALDHPGAQIIALVDAEVRSLQLTPEDLAKPPERPARRGRPRR